MEGLNGVIFVQAVHYFPFILINLSAALRNIDRAMEEAAQNLGSSGFRLFRRIVLPLAMPGYVAGASLVFVKVFDDLATPLLLNVKDMLAPQAYLRVTSIGIADPDGLRDLGGAHRRLDPGDVDLGARDARQGLRHRAARRRRARAPPHETVGSRARLYGRVPDPAARAGAASRLAAPLLCDGLVVSARCPTRSPSPITRRVFGDSSVYIKNTLIYASLAGLIDVVLGTAIAYLVLRTKLVGRDWLDWAATAALAIPGVVLGIGYLRAFYGVTLPDGTPLATLVDR